MEIYLVRHGKTDWNVAHRLQGSENTPLNSEGRELAGQVGRALEDVPFDVIYSSPLDRAYETACLIRGHRNIPIIKDERLREIAFGINEGRFSADILKNPDDPFRYFFTHPELYLPTGGGETFEEVRVRTADFMKNEIEPKKNTWERIMIVAHGALNKGILSHVRGNDISHYWDGEVQKNCGIVILGLDDEGYRFIDEECILYDTEE